MSERVEQRLFGRPVKELSKEEWDAKHGSTVCEMKLGTLDKYIQRRIEGRPGSDFEESDDCVTWTPVRADGVLTKRWVRLK